MFKLLLTHNAVQWRLFLCSDLTHQRDRRSSCTTTALTSTFLQFLHTLKLLLATRETFLFQCRRPWSCFSSLGSQPLFHFQQNAVGLLNFSWLLHHLFITWIVISIPIGLMSLFRNQLHWAVECWGHKAEFKSDSKVDFFGDWILTTIATVSPHRHHNHCRHTSKPSKMIWKSW